MAGTSMAASELKANSPIVLFWPVLRVCESKASRSAQGMTTETGVEYPLWVFDESTDVTT